MKAVAGIKKDIGIVEKLEGASPEDIVLLKANLYISHGLFNEAEKILAAHMWENPAGEPVRDILIFVYEKMGNIPKARSLL